jgi:hypothetical protein
MIVQSSRPIFFKIANLEAIRAHTTSTAIAVIVAFVAMIVGPRFWARNYKWLKLVPILGSANSEFLTSADNGAVVELDILH